MQALPMVFTDSYKLSHKGFMDANITKIYSNMTARSSKHFPMKLSDNRVVFFGLQYFIKDFLVDYWNDKFFSQPKDVVIGKFKHQIDAYLGPGAVPMEHFEELHDLGYLPLLIKAVPEGSRVNIRVPMVTVQNTHPDFAWLTNYIETVWSCDTWKPITTATLIYEMRKIINQYAMETTGSLDGTQFQLHDFGFRGMSGRQDAAVNGAAFLLSSNGSDTVPALSFIEDFYATDCTKEFIATSVPATEHMVACGSTAIRGELESYRKWITQDYPTGIVSLVSDTYNYWTVLTEYLPALKDDILARPVNALGLSKVVIRPDSGDPYRIICGYDDYDQRNYSTLAEIYSAYDGKYTRPEVIKFQGKWFELRDHDPSRVGLDWKELSEAEVKGTVRCLWDVFGGQVNSKGYKQLDSHIGVIYGDSITPKIMISILNGLKRLGFSTTNIVFGVGSYTMNYLTRDSLGIAVKATYQETIDDNGVEMGYALYKDPVTDNGVKKSAKGLLRVEYDTEKDEFKLLENVSWDEEDSGELKWVFFDGLCKTESFTKIRDRLWNN